MEPRHARVQPKLLHTTRLIDNLTDHLEPIKASFRADIQAKFEHPFRAFKHQLDHFKVRYGSLRKNRAQLQTLLALSALRMTR